MHSTEHSNHTSASSSKHNSGEELPSVDVVASISVVLEMLVEDNEKNSEKLSAVIAEQKELPFYYHKIPKLSLREYLERICLYLEFSDSTLIVALIYIDRICEKKGILLTRKNIYRLLFTAILLSVKFNEDHRYKLDFCAKVAGVQLGELAEYEETFIDIMNFEFYVSEEEFFVYKNHVLLLSKDDDKM